MPVSLTVFRIPGVLSSLSQCLHCEHCDQKTGRRSSGDSGHQKNAGLHPPALRSQPRPAGSDRYPSIRGSFIGLSATPSEYQLALTLSTVLKYRTEKQRCWFINWQIELLLLCICRIVSGHKLSQILQMCGARNVTLIVSPDVF